MVWKSPLPFNERCLHQDVGNCSDSTNPYLSICQLIACLHCIEGTINSRQTNICPRLPKDSNFNLLSCSGFSIVDVHGELQQKTHLLYISFYFYNTVYFILTYGREVFLNFTQICLVTAWFCKNEGWQLSLYVSQ
jgi:hypothetical protein